MSDNPLEDRTPDPRLASRQIGPGSEGDDGQHLALTVPTTETEGAVVADAGDEFEIQTTIPYPIVAIGASAGGVEAYIELFRGLTADTGMSFVVVPHLLSDHKSHLVEILSRITPMPVIEIRDGMTPEPDRVYVLPPNTRARMERGSLRLERRIAHTMPHPIDYFFRSLASDQKTRSVGVVLSGSDSDGALGLKAIKGEGGITIVQSPESAQFPEMPRMSISTDHVDRVLPPGQIGTELVQLGRQFRQPLVQTLESGAPEPREEQYFFRILNLLRGVSDVDFRLYNPNTIRRRVGRRMLLHGIQSLGEYAAFLQANPKELRELQEDALINVTRFFRDPHVFDALKQTVLPRILADREADQQVRIWIAGCSTGEEAYSIAMCLLEYVTGQSFEPPIQIFGTDASELNIQRARAGIFPESVLSEVSEDRLRRFFVKVDKGYQVAKRVRGLCIFARQNLSLDPPFSNMDLISCRNVLIYMGPELQKQILPTFHYALRPNGFLLLGTSETIREFTDLFQLTDRKNKIFAKVGNDTARTMMTVAPRLFSPEPGNLRGGSPPPEHWGNSELQRAADRIILARYAPAGIIVDERQEIIQFRGHTAPFLEMSPGIASLQLRRMLRESIAVPVQQAVQNAIDQDIPVRVEGLRVHDDDHERHFTLEVLPIHSILPRSRYFLVLFVPAVSGFDRGETKESGGALESGDRENAVERLRQDLASTKLYLETLLEERDAKNQELVSANEELQSANEELQSTTEELETTEEELQSSNEELQTVNGELQHRNTVLTQANDDVSNLLKSVNLPVLMLSNEMHVRYFTPPIERLMNLRAADIGRPFSDIRLNLKIDNLEPLVMEVLETLTPGEMEMEDREGHSYILRVRPYRTTDNKIDGVVIVLLDIDQLRRSEQEVRKARDFSQSVMESVPLAVAVVDLDLKIRCVNDAFRRLAGKDLQRHYLPDLASAAWKLQEPLRSSLEDLLASKDTGKHFEFEYMLPDETRRVFNIRGCVVKPGNELFLLVTIEDVTAHKEVQRLLSVDRERLAVEIASTARELGRTQDELRALAASLLTSQEDERRRVARELHDDISQKLAVVEIDIQQLQQRLTADEERDRTGRTAQDLEQLRKSISELSGDVRRISHALHPSVIDDLGLSPALRSLIEDFREREHMIATFSSQDLPEDIPGDIATGLYRITQEALRNVAKHAGKTHVKVTVRGEATRIRLEIADSGEGFDLHSRRSGLGLISMEERVGMMRGSFSVDSKLGEGTRINVDIPWTRKS